MKPYQLGLYEKAMPEAWSWPHKMSAAGQLGFDFIEMSIDETQQGPAKGIRGMEQTGAECQLHLSECSQKISDRQPFSGNPRERNADYGACDCTCL